GNRFEAIEAGGKAEIAGVLGGSGQIQTSSARARARRALDAYAEDLEATGPGFADYARAVRYDLDRMIGETQLPPDRICRRLTALGADHPRFGYVRANAAGAMLELRTLPGFQPARSAPYCPIWALARAGQTPERAIRQLAAFPNGQRFVLVARARPTGVAGYAAARHFVTDMLVIGETDASATVYAADPGLQAEAVGTACRICPRESCALRTEDPISG
ncbi:MAG: short-chain fatty acyl-CoA regulator family protein, partial [Pseudomonadota bacterium]